MKLQNSVSFGNAVLIKMGKEAAIVRKSPIELAEKITGHRYSQFTIVPNKNSDFLVLSGKEANVFKHAQEQRAIAKSKNNFSTFKKINMEIIEFLAHLAKKGDTKKFIV